MFHLCRNQVVGFYWKMFEKHMWKSDISSKDAGHDLHFDLKSHSSTGVFQTF